MAKQYVVVWKRSDSSVEVTEPFLSKVRARKWLLRHHGKASYAKEFDSGMPVIVACTPVRCCGGVSQV